MSATVWGVVIGGILVAYALGAWLGHALGYRKGRFDERFDKMIK